MSQNIFCNSCFETKEDSTRTFSCTSCSHVFCSTCLSNFENFCLICKVKCKVLEINEDLPAEVKLVFDDTSFKSCLDNATRVYNFQENQTRLYTERVKINVEKYRRIKKDVLRLKQFKLDSIKNIKIEKSYMEKLKNAYRTGKITSDLFALGSPNTTELLGSQPKTARMSTSSSPSLSSSSFFSSGAASQTISPGTSSEYSSNTGSISFGSTPNRSRTPGSSVFRNFGRTLPESPLTDSQQTKTQQQRRFSNEEKVNRPFIPPNTRKLPPLNPISQSNNLSEENSQRNIFMKTRQDLLENTLRHMQIVSQSNYQHRKNQ
ncbi:unnamed protein product [Diamesa serratosioi]